MAIWASINMGFKIDELEVSKYIDLGVVKKLKSLMID